MTAAATTGYGLREHRGMITLTVMVASIIQAIDATIANVALPRMQGSMSATQDQMTWILTSYIVAAAIMTPLSGWCADRFGRKPVFLFSVVAFTITSALCGMAQSLDQAVIFRLLQGASGAALMPLSQAVLFDVYPPSQHGRAMSIWGLGVVLGPLLGPVVGGWLTDNYSWRWVFYINVPFGVLAVLGVLAYMPDTKHSRKSFDFFGFATLSLFVGALQVFLDRGPSKDWFNSAEIKLEAVIAALALYVFLVHSLLVPRPFVRLALFRDRNFLSGTVLTFLLGMVVLASLSLMPSFLQGLMNYSVLQAGYMMSPRSIGTVISMLVVGRIIGRVDVRLLIGAGLVLAAYSMFMMTRYSLQMDMEPIYSAGLVQGFGTGLAWVPMTTLAFATLAPATRNEATALFSLVRNLGTSIGISIAQGLLIHNMQVIHVALAAHVTPYVRASTHLPGAAGAKAAALVSQQLSAQATMIAYIDDFKFLALLTIAALPFLLVVRSAPPAESRLADALIE